MYKTVRVYRALYYPASARVVTNNRFVCCYIIHDDVGTVFYDRCDSVTAAVLKIHTFIPRGWEKAPRWELIENA